MASKWGSQPEKVRNGSFNKRWVWVNFGTCTEGCAPRRRCPRTPRWWPAASTAILAWRRPSNSTEWRHPASGTRARRRAADTSRSGTYCNARRKIITTASLQCQCRDNLKTSPLKFRPDSSESVHKPWHESIRETENSLTMNVSTYFHNHNFLYSWTDYTI